MNAIKTIILSVVSFVFFAVLIELGAYGALQYGKEPEGISLLAKKPDAELPLIYNPLLMRSQRPDTRFGITGQLRTDAYGHLDVPERTDNPNLTVVITGSSSVHSPQPFNALEDTFAYQLQTLLRERLGRPVNVVNLAGPAYSTFQEMMSLYEYFEVHRLRADLVLSVGGSFSTTITMKEDHTTLYSIYSAKRSRDLQRLVDRDVKLVPPLLGALFTENTNTGRLMLKIATRLSNRAPKPDADYAAMLKPDDAFIALLVKRERTNYEVMNLLSKEAGAQFAAILLPTQNTLPDSTGGAAKFQAERNWINALQDQLLAQPSPFPLIDLRNMPMAPAEAYFSDTKHFTAAGTKAVAAVTYERLMRLPLIVDFAESSCRKAGSQGC